MSLKRAFHLLHREADRRSERMSRLAQAVIRSVRDEVRRLEDHVRLTEEAAWGDAQTG